MGKVAKSAETIWMNSGVPCARDHPVLDLLFGLPKTLQACLLRVIGASRLRNNPICNSETNVTLVRPL